MNVCNACRMRGGQAVHVRVMRYMLAPNTRVHRYQRHYCVDCIWYACVLKSKHIGERCADRCCSGTIAFNVDSFGKEH